MGLFAKSKQYVGAVATTYAQLDQTVLTRAWIALWTSWLLK